MSSRKLSKRLNPNRTQRLSRLTYCLSKISKSNQTVCLSAKTSCKKLAKNGVLWLLKKRANTSKRQKCRRVTTRTTMPSRLWKMIGKKIPSSVVSLTGLTPLGKFMQLPLNKVRAIINLDDESSVYSKEALVLITKATEMFVNDLSGVCAQIAKLQKRKTLQI